MDTLLWAEISIAKPIHPQLLGHPTTASLCHVNPHANYVWGCHDMRVRLRKCVCLPKACNERTTRHQSSAIIKPTHQRQGRGGDAGHLLLQATDCDMDAGTWLSTIHTPAQPDSSNQCIGLGHANAPPASGQKVETTTTAAHIQLSGASI